MTILCEYCGEAFTPTRRFVQKFCCDSCRVLDYRKRKKEAEIRMLIDKALDKVRPREAGEVLPGDETEPG